MARDKITVDLMLATKQAEREIDKINRKVADIGKSMGKSFGGMGGGTDKVRALGTGLSKATVKADEFSKSLEASNARVIAFGASAGLIMGVERALKAMVVSAVKVEKAMMDVSVVMQVSNRQLEQFGKGMFRVAKETAQGFDTVAEAATELARQGLGMEKTLSRTKDALILTRLTGMNAADSVKALTAAVNSFNKEGITSTQIVNRMAKVDAAFAVSSEDLAKSISRVGASAISAGVGMNELMAITTAVQQKTARGGAVIGNAFKTIFTRIQRSDVQKKLRDMGIASTDMQGRMLNGMKVLQNMAGGFDKLTKSQQASLAENVAGVFQVNILKAALSDLTAQTSNYKGALDAANSATNEAYQRNEQLNQTLDALSNRTLANLTKAGSTIGGATLEPAIRKVLNSVNTVIDAFSEGGRFEKFGSTMGKGLLDGIGNFIKGPGLIIVGTAFMKLGLSLAKFAGAAFKDLMGLNAATKQRAALEEAVIAHIASEPALLAKVRTGTLNVLAVEKDILATVRAANVERARIQAYAAPLAGALVSRGMRAGSKGATIPGGAAGFVPNFASPAGERAAAAAGGYRAGSIKTMNQPGAGTMMYNSAETVKKFPGMSQSAIMPPQSSPAGAGYRSAFGAAHGFDPYAGRGFVPNFRLGRPPKGDAHTFKRGKEESFATGKRGDVVNMHLTLPSKKRDMGIITEQGTDTTPIIFSQNIMNPKAGIPELASGMKTWQGNDGRRVGKATLRVSGIPVVPVFPISRENMSLTGGSNKKPTQPGKYLQKTLNRYSERLSKEMFGTTDVQRDFDVEGLSQGTMGDIFEEGVRVAVGGAKNDDRLAAFDYMGKKFANTRLIGFFNRQGRSANLDPVRTKIEAKIGAEAAESGNIPKKMINDPDVGYNKKDVMKLFQNEFRAVTGSKSKRLKGTKTAARGFVPNFSALSDAVGREMSAGVPASAIRVGSSSALKSAGNPGGVGVYNTIHEPGGLNQGIARSRAQGVNPRSHGVPNFQLAQSHSGLMAGADLTVAEKHRAAWDKIAKEGSDSAKTTSGAATKFEKASNGILMASMMISMAGPGMASAMGARPSTQAQISAGSNILAMAGMGLAMTGGNPLGALGGAALGAVTSMGDLKTGFGEEGRRADAKAAKDYADSISEGLSKIEVALKGLADAPFQDTEERIKSFSGLITKLDEVQKDLIAGGPENERALNAFLKARNAVGSVEDYQKMSPSQKKTFLSSTSKLIDKSREAADATLTAGSRSAYNEAMTGGAVELIQKRSVAKAAEEIGITRGQIKFGAKYGAPVMTQAQLQRRRTQLLEEETGFGPMISDAFRPSFQTELAEMPGGDAWEDRRSGKEALAEYSRLMKGNKGRKAMEVMANLLGRTDRGKMMAEDLRSALAQEDSFIPFIGDKLTDADVMAAAGTGDGTATPFGVMQRDSDTRGAFGVLQLIERGRERGLLPMFDPKIADPKKDKGLTDSEKRSLENERVASLMALNAPRETAQMRGRMLGFTLQRNVAGRRRGLDLSNLGRTQQAQLNAASGMFGSQLFEETGRLKQIGAFDTLEAAQRNITDTRDLTIGKSQQTARAAYLKTLGDKAIKTGDRVAAQQALPGLETMTLDEKKAERDRLRVQEAKTPSEVSSAKIEYLTSVIDGETKAREIHTHKQGEATEEYQKNTKVIDSNTKHLKKMEEASHHFYKGAFLNNLQKQANVLGEQIQFEEEQVAAGRLSVEVLTESRMKFADLNQQLTGTGNHLEVLNERFKKILSGPLSNKEITDATIAAQKGLNQQVRGRQLSGAGAAGIIPNAQAAFDANQITAGELRAIKSNARLNAPGATGNPMEAFKDQFMYGGRDAMLDFESGVIGVADTMKSSFSDAFQNIANGSMSAGGAIAQMADGILNSISSMTANMATNMMFAKMFPGKSQGGPISKFNSGGIVTGGSGYRDDVPAMMNGGEFVIKKSSAQKIGYGALNAINSGSARGYAEGGSTGGPGMGSMFAVSAGASALSGLLNQSGKGSKKKPWRGKNYGFGRGEHGYFGGPDADAGGTSSFLGGGNAAQVSLNKAYVYYRRDPKTGKLISERARPTEGRYEVSSALSLAGRLGEGDPQTARMSGKETKMGSYSDYLFNETARRKAVIKAHEKQKRGRLISAYMNAAMLMGGSYLMGKTGPMTSELTGASVSAGGRKNFNALSASQRGGMSARDYLDAGVGINDSGIPDMAAGGSTRGSSAAMLTGGEYVMGADTVRQYGLGFMGELNRGNVSGMAAGGPVGGFTGGGVGSVNNNVSVNVNIDKRGNGDASSSPETSTDNTSSENSTAEAQRSKDLGVALQTVVLQEIMKQQRPGGLLQGKPNTP